MLQGRLTVLVLADRDESRTQYLDTLTAAGCAVRVTDAPDRVIGIASVLRLDVVVLDIGLQATAFAVADSLATLPDRPRLVAVTDRVPIGTAIEHRFDAYVLDPWSPETLIDAIQSAIRAPVPLEDLLIVARDHIGSAAAMQRFGDIGARVEFRLDQRHGERRRPHAGSAHERRRRDRRERDVTERLRTAGWVLIPAAQRG